MRNFKPLAIFCGCTDPFVWDLVRNPEDQFSHNEAQLLILVRTFSDEIFILTGLQGDGSTPCGHSIAHVFLLDHELCTSWYTCLAGP